MDSDAPHPHCPFCGLPMQIVRDGHNARAHSFLHSFDCKWCGVVLNVSPRAEVIQLASATALIPN
jgi:transposase-like protein